MRAQAIGGGSRSRKNVGIIELIAYTVASEWAELLAVPRFKRQLYSIMPQIVAVWCRQLGHRVTYASYWGQCDPVGLLPDDLDIVFIAASTQASALAYALARLYRTRGIVTVAGGPHARSFPDDCARFFDLTVTTCDRDLVADLVAGRFGVLIKLTRLAQTIAIRRDIAEMREIRDALRVDRRMQAFHEGRRLDLPDLYRRHLSRRLGRFGELLTAADLVPVLAGDRSFQRATTRSGMVVASSRSADRPAQAAGEGGRRQDGV